MSIKQTLVAPERAIEDRIIVGIGVISTNGILHDNHGTRLQLQVPFLMSISSSHKIGSTQ